MLGVIQLLTPPSTTITLAFNAPKQTQNNLPLLPLRAQHSNWLSSSNNYSHRPSSLSTTTTTTTRSRSLICRPPSAKYIRKDYLVKKVTAQEVQELVKGERKVPIILDFYATWCGPCVLMAQELEMLAVEYENNVLILKVDTDDEYAFARDMQVRGLPTVYFISPDSSKDAIRTEGLIPIQMMRDVIDNEM